MWLFEQTLSCWTTQQWNSGKGCPSAIFYSFHAKQHTTRRSGNHLQCLLPLSLIHRNRLQPPWYSFTMWLWWPVHSIKNISIHHCSEWCLIRDAVVGEGIRDASRLLPCIWQQVACMRRRMVLYWLSDYELISYNITEDPCWTLYKSMSEFWKSNDINIKLQYQSCLFVHVEVARPCLSAILGATGVEASPQHSRSELRDFPSLAPPVLLTTYAHSLL